MKNFLINAIILIFVIHSLSDAKENTGLNLVKFTVIPSVNLIEPEGAFTLACKFKIKKGWHIYYQNPGDAGLATKIEIEYENKAVLYDTEYPIPQIEIEGDIGQYIYKDETMCFSDVRLPPNLKPGEYFYIKVKASWLVCREGCIPGKTEINIKVKVGLKTIDNPNWKKLTGKYNFLLPLRSFHWIYSSVRTDSNVKIKFFKNNNYKMDAQKPDDYFPEFKKLYFIPITDGIFCNACRQDFMKVDNGYEITIRLDKMRASEPVNFNGVIVADKLWDKRNSGKAIIVKIR